jgi:hypothetical protein
MPYFGLWVGLLGVRWFVQNGLISKLLYNMKQINLGQGDFGTLPKPPIVAAAWYVWWWRFFFTPTSVDKIMETRRLEANQNPS